ncbi:MAG: 5-formyltetrahydrofolate cyclo-ligase [Betaproteobacteria bacterium]
MSLTPELRSWRATQREALLTQRMAIGQAQHARWNAQITTRLLAALRPPHGAVVAAYWPFKGEFDPRFAMRALRQGGARTALPVVLQKAQPLQFRDWWPGMATSPGVYGLPVPQGGDIVTPQLALIPPIGFDAMGYRLGYGGGYYDRTLAALAPQTLKIGVAFESSRIASIQPQPHDIAMDFIVTQDAWYQATAQGLVLLDPNIVPAHLAQSIAGVPAS